MSVSSLQVAETGERLELREVSHRYPGPANGDGYALSALSLAVEPGEFVALLGPSGCGKTTVLKVVAGLLRPSGGEVLVGGERMNGLAPEARRMAMVFQRPLLFPHMGVAANVGFGLKMRAVSRRETARRVAEALGQVRMTGFADRRPDELSGGQQQRVALARALVTDPRVLLLDEPFSALDANLREEMRSLIKRLHSEGDFTTVFVTHDQEEAVVLADRIALLFGGELQMYAPPETFYDRPANRRVAEFFGATNFLKGGIQDGVAETALGRLRTSHTPPNGTYTLTIRPEAVRLQDTSPQDNSRDRRTAENTFLARVMQAEYLGTQVLYTLDSEGGRIRASTPPHLRLAAGETVSVRLPAEALWPLEE